VKLCVRALEAGIEVGYVQELIRRNRLTLEEPPDHLGSWPWPLRVFTLGGFRLETNGGPVQFSRKVQQKPLLLLKALIAMGGADVREEQLSDLLWPDADGDAAHSVFTTTLSRLRDLLGPETAIRVQESRVTLDAQVCWVDAWAFERLLAKIERHLRDGRGETVPDGPSSLPEFIEKTMTLYPGHFLPGDEAHVWTASYRERLRAKLLRLLTRWGERLEQAEDWKAAVECYQRGLEVDELAEAFYQRLMSCYQHLGLRAEALATYARCKAVLSRGLGVTPSPKTEALARTLRG
jgi:DNA-binding SARP family transcriptional activator